MGLRQYLKGKVDKHGGVAAAAKAAIQRPLTLVNGGAGMRSSAPNTEVAPDKLQEAFSNLPEAPDADGLIAVSTSAFVYPGRPGTFEAFGRAVAVFRVDDALYAIDQACTHEDGPLGEADKVDGTVITCPYHDWQFDLRDGSCLSEPSRPVPTYDVAEHDGFIWLGHPRGEVTFDRGGHHEDGMIERLTETTRL
jgi:nitrite reductase/ring-hydroxylating ferredoxin subunit